jgi:hypothetical protein
MKMLQYNVFNLVRRYGAVDSISAPRATCPL